MPSTSPSNENSQLRWFDHVPGKPRKIGGTSRAVHTHGKAVQMSTKGQVAWLHHRPCLFPVAPQGGALGSRALGGTLLIKNEFFKWFWKFSLFVIIF